MYDIGTGEVIAIETILYQMQDYFSKNMDSFLTSLQEHITISLLALLFAILIGFGIAYLCLCYKRSEAIMLMLFQTLRLIPSLAILILLIPLVGTGIKPALCALTLLAIPPILMNTLAGFESVPDVMIETASALGMEERQIFWRVKLPLALPLLLAGIKTSLIEVVASATIAAKIGAGGLGGLIFTGIGLDRTDLLLIGGGSVALLSILFSVLLNGLDRLVLRYKFIRK